MRDWKSPCCPEKIKSPSIPVISLSTLASFIVPLRTETVPYASGCSTVPVSLITPFNGPVASLTLVVTRGITAISASLKSIVTSIDLPLLASM